MADNTLTSATTTAIAAEMADQPQQNCPLMKLPTELRLRIYKFALNDIVDDIESDAAKKKQAHQDAEKPWPSSELLSEADHPTFVGVLGLLHISRELRRECLDALRAPTKAFKRVCSDHHKVTAKAFCIPVRDHNGNLWHYKEFFRVYRLRRMEYDEAVYRLRRMEFICNAIALVGRNARSGSRSSHAPSSKAVD